MVNKKQIKEVEEIQRINRGIECLEEDYNHLPYMEWTRGHYNYTSYYIKMLRIIIKLKIKQLKRKKKRMMED